MRAKATRQDLVLGRDRRIVAVWFAFDSQRPDGSALFWSSVILVNLVAYLIHSVVERPVERLRRFVRPS